MWDVEQCSFNVVPASATMANINKTSIINLASNELIEFTGIYVFQT